MFKLILVCAALIVSALADVKHILPETAHEQPFTHNHEVNPDGSYSFNYGTSDGISHQQSGSIRNLNEQSFVAVEGSFSYTGSDGKVYNVRYTADENGYQPSGDHIHQIPETIQRAVEYIRSVNAQQKSEPILTHKL